MSRRAEEEIKSISRFSTLMLEKLAANRDKPHWSECDTDWLFERLHEEHVELGEAVETYFTALGRLNTRRGTDLEVWEAEQAVRREAADVANFAMMIAENLDRPRPEERN